VRETPKKEKNKLKNNFLHVPLLAVTAGLLLLSSLAPAFAQSEGGVQVNGAVNENLTLSIDQLRAMPATTVEATIYCYGSYVTSGNWTGVQLRLLLDKAGLESEAASVEFYATDGYAVSIPLTYALLDNVIIAYDLDGNPLSEVLRLVLPGANGNAWISMINEITVGTTTVAPPLPIQGGQPSVTPPPAENPGSQQSPTPSPPPASTPQPGNQTTTQPDNAPTDSQPQPEASTTSTTSLPEYAPITMIATTIIATITAAYLFQKYGKKPTTPHF
jgi:hypothetical protein